jgi:O-antigen ligase/tetratricopeptide (TPR) repeat protein
VTNLLIKFIQKKNHLMKKQDNRSTKKTTIDSNHKNSNYYDFVSLSFLIGYLLIDFMPYAQRMEIIKPQFLYLTVLNISVGLYIYFNPALFSNSLLTIFKKSYIFKAYLLFILLAGLSIFSARNISLSINAIAEIVVVFCMFINFAILLYNRMHLIYKLTFIVGICAFLQAANSLLDLKEFFFENKSLAEVIVSIKGNTGNMNILAASVMAKIPFVLIGITYFSNWKKWILLLALLLATTLIFLLNPRSSLLSLIVIVIVYLVYYFKTHSFKKTSLINTTYILLPIIISLIIANILFSNSNKGDLRASSTIERLEQISITDASANIRLTFWKTALGFIKGNPVSGIGLGNWRIESIPFEAYKDRVVSLNTHNDFLEIATETGILNGLIYLSIFIVLLVINVKRTLRIKSKENLIVILPLLLLIVYGTDALFNFPLYRPTMQLCFCFLMAFTFVGNIKSDTNLLPSKDSNLIKVLILIAIVPLYVTYYADKTSQLEYKIKSDNIDFNAIGKVNGDEVVSQKPLFPNVFNTSESFEEYAGIYYLREKKYDLAMKHFDIANTINPHLGRPNFYKYLMAAERGMPDSAYYYVKSSFYTYPASTTLFNALIIAQKHADTAEILKMYKLNYKYQKDPLAWSKTVTILQGANYSRANLDQFLKQGMLDFPNDSTIKNTYNATKITEHIIKGQALFAAGKHNEALDTYKLGLSIDSTNIYIQQNLGFYYYNLGKPNDAIPYFLKALQKPGLFDGKTEYYLAICYINTKQKENACKYLNISLTRNYPDAKTALNQFCN